MHKYFVQILLFTFVFVYGSSTILAQITEPLNNKIEDGYIEKMNDKLAMDISFNNSFEVFEVKTTSNKVILYPNTPTNLGLHLNYRFFSFGYQFSPDFLPGNGDEYEKGKTKSFELGTALIFKHWFTNVDYTKVKGYYLENSEDYASIPTGEPFIQFPDLHYKSFALGLGYSSNSKFSIRSLTSQTERQLKSAGSFIPVLNLRYYTVDDKSPANSTQKSRNFETSIGPGYAYTYVVREKLYLSLGLSVSAGYLNTKLTTRSATNDFISHQDNFIFRWDGKTGIGYNGPKFYTGLYANVSGTQYKQENTTVINFDTRVVYHLFFGMRIKAPDYINRKLNQIEEKFNSVKENTK